MQKKRITYGISGMMTYQAIFNAGRNNRIKVTFSDGSIAATGKKPATFTTEDFMLQHIIENSKLYKDGFIYRYRVLLLNEKVKIEHNGPKFECHKPHGPKEPKDRDCCQREEDNFEVEIPDDNNSCEEKGCPESCEQKAQEQDEEPAESAELKFSSNDEAKDYLEANYDTKDMKLRTRPEIIAAAAQLGLKISFGK